MSRIALILGANGRLGRALTDAFLAADWRVLAQVRRPGAHSPQAALRWVQVPIEDPATLAETVRAADVVVHAANPPYPRWQREARPLARSAVQIARRLNALLMFPGNVYNFGAGMPELLAETTPQHPTSRKGRIRVEIEEHLREEARSGLRSVVIRAGDFFGGPGRGSWFDLVIAKSVPRGLAVYPGPTRVMHAWAYLPDLARVFALVAERRTDLAVFETLHFAGHAASGKTFLDSLADAARRLGLATRLRREKLPWLWLRLGGVVVPMWRELGELRYLWRVLHRLSGEKLEQLLGTVPATPLDQAIETALRELFERRLSA